MHAIYGVFAKDIRRGFENMANDFAVRMNSLGFGSAPAAEDDGGQGVAAAARDAVANEKAEL